jgi:hypothetical protein
MFDLNNLLLSQCYVGGIAGALAVRQWGHLVSRKAAVRIFWSLFAVILLAFIAVAAVFGLDTVPPSYVLFAGLTVFWAFIASFWLMTGRIPLRKKRVG